MRVARRGGGVGWHARHPGSSTWFGSPPARRYFERESSRFESWSQPDPGTARADSKVDDLLNTGSSTGALPGHAPTALMRTESDTDVRGVFVAPPGLALGPSRGPPSISSEARWRSPTGSFAGLRSGPQGQPQHPRVPLHPPHLGRLRHIGHELLSNRTPFLSRMVHQTFNGYVISQFKKIERDLRAIFTPNGSTLCT